jgi:methylated-DNA-[protein]-cysteine S-methyltransferase
MQTATIETPLGAASIEGDENGICQLKLQEGRGGASKEVPDELLFAADQLEAYFRGELKKFSFKLNLQGTDFQKKVWEKLREISYGKTVTYAEIAQKIDNAKAVRAVAAANGKNPLWIIVPCHRVIGSDGSLTGYAGGLWRKKWLLAHESPHPQQSLF